MSLGTLSDEQQARLDVLLALYDRVTVETIADDLVAWAHWVTTGHTIYYSEADSKEVESPDRWAPAVVSCASGS